MLFGLISTRRGLLQLAGAGHPTRFIVRASAVERPLLLTGGIAELRNADGDFFEDEMAGLLAGRHDTPAADIVADLEAAGAAFSARPPGDDLALLCIRVTVGGAVD